MFFIPAIEDIDMALIDLEVRPAVFRIKLTELSLCLTAAEGVMIWKISRLRLL